MKFAKIFEKNVTLLLSRPFRILPNKIPAFVLILNLSIFSPKGAFLWVLAKKFQPVNKPKLQPFFSTINKYFRENGNERNHEEKGQAKKFTIIGREKRAFVNQNNSLDFLLNQAKLTKLEENFAEPKTGMTKLTFQFYVRVWDPDGLAKHSSKKSLFKFFLQDIVKTQRMLLYLQKQIILCPFWFVIFCLILVANHIESLWIGIVSSTGSIRLSKMCISCYNLEITKIGTLKPLED